MITFQPRAIGSLAEFEGLHTVILQRKALPGPLDDVSRAERPDESVRGPLMTFLPKSLRTLVLIGFSKEILEHVCEPAAEKKIRHRT